MQNFQPKTIIFSRGEKAPTSRGKDFSGIQRSFIFKLNRDRPLAMKSVTFFGPSRDSGTGNPMSEVQYNLSIAVKEWDPSRFHNLNLYLPETTILMKAKIDEKFKVEFKTPVAFPGYKWIEIKFQLDGPKTGLLEPKDVYKTTFYDVEGNVEIHALIGSSQLAEFTIIEQ